MRIRTTGTHLGRHLDGIHDLFWRGITAECRAGVSTYAISALGGVRHRQGDQLLDLLQQRTIAEQRIDEHLEDCQLFRGQRLAACREGGG